MSERKGPLTAALGVPVHYVEECGLVVLPDDLEQALAGLPVITRYEDQCLVHWNTSDVFGTPDLKATHTARLLAIQPIVRDTAESLLREFVEKSESYSPRVLTESEMRSLLGEFYDRAKAQLAKEAP